VPFLTWTREVESESSMEKGKACLRPSQPGSILPASYQHTFSPFVELRSEIDLPKPPPSGYFESELVDPLDVGSRATSRMVHRGRLLLLPSPSCLTRWVPSPSGWSNLTSASRQPHKQREMRHPRQDSVLAGCTPLCRYSFDLSSLSLFGLVW
jgi:hypothetical protein